MNCDEIKIINVVEEVPWKTSCNTHNRPTRVNRPHSWKDHGFCAAVN